MIYSSLFRTRHTVIVHNRHTTDVPLDQQMDDIHNWGIHKTCRNVCIRAHIHFLQRLTQLLRILHIHSNDFYNAILRDNRNDHGTFRFVINVDYRNAARAGLKHFSTCFIDRTVGVTGYRFDGIYT